MGKQRGRDNDAWERGRHMRSSTEAFEVSIHGILPEKLGAGAESSRKSLSHGHND